MTLSERLDAIDEQLVHAAAWRENAAEFHSALKQAREEIVGIRKMLADLHEKVVGIKEAIEEEV